MRIAIPTKVQLKAMTIAQLHAGLKRAEKFTTEGLRALAAYWTELKNRGEDLPVTLWSEHYPAIAEGKMDPRLITIFGGKHSAVLTSIGKLPLEQQAKTLTPDYKVPVLVPKEDGSDYEVVERPVAALKVTEVYQVFGEGAVRTPDEQRQYVPPLKPAAASPPSPPPPPAQAKSEDDPDGALPCDVAGLAWLDLTPVQRREAVRYAETRRPPTSLKELFTRWLIQKDAMKETPVSSKARRMRMSEQEGLHLYT